jgi:hypothetical protein
MPTVRGMARPRRYVLLLLAFCASFALGGADPAVGATAASHSPATFVAGPTPSGTTLVARDTPQGLCLGLHPRPAYADSYCAHPSMDLRNPSYTLGLVGVNGTTGYIYGTVRSPVAAVELVLPSGQRIRVAASSGRYQGRYAARLRFFVAQVPLPKGFRLFRYLRLLDDGGRLLAVTSALEQYADVFGARSSPIAVLQSGRVKNASWRLRAFRRTVLTPVPRDEERFEERTCVDGGPGGIIDGAEVCRRAAVRLGDLSFQVRTHCGAIGTMGVGLVGSRVATVRARFGSGRSRRVRLAAVPAALGEGRAFSVVARNETALRSVAAFDAGGRLLQRLSLNLAPGSLSCGHSGGLDTIGGDLGVYGVTTGFEVPHLRAPALQVRDDDTRICATLGQFSPTGADCFLPPLGSLDFHVLRNAGKSPFVAGVAPGNVTRVDAVFSHGRRVSVPATLNGPYSGRYLGTIRFFSARLPGKVAPEKLEAFDALGHRVASRLVVPDETSVEPPRTLLRGAGGFKVGVGFVHGGSFGSDLCAVSGHGRLSKQARRCGSSFDFSDDDQQLGALSIVARCRPHQIEIGGTLARRVRSVRIATNRGTVRAATARVHLFGRRGQVVLAVVPGNARVRAAIVETSHGTIRRAIRAPSAKSQCGWTADDTRL